MVASLRQFLIVLLVLLQMAAPLVHAHVGNHASGVSGVHLPELEQLRNAGDATAALVTVQHIDSLSAIVGLGSAIKLPKVDDNMLPTVLLTCNFAFCPPSPSVERVNFSPHRPQLVQTPTFLSDNICRAPPM